jgi:hydroxymethylglutaryl-CoA lyase
MPEHIKIIECPRDAWQGLLKQIPSEVKAAYLHQLIEAGFKHIDAVSFVSPAAVPQMADSETVLKLLRPPKDVEIIGIVVNERGAERAIESCRVKTIGFPYSVSEEFLQRNQRQTRKSALATLEKLSALATSSGLQVIAYVSMAFGNPYDEQWSAAKVGEACKELESIGIRQISLADTVGIAMPKTIKSTFATARKACKSETELGVHLHATMKQAAKRIEAAYEAGCRRFDSAIGGLGGCPFAQDELVGNIATEAALATLELNGAQLPKLAIKTELMDLNRKIAADYSL